MRLRRVVRSPLLFWCAASVLALATAATITREAQGQQSSAVVVVRVASISPARLVRAGDVEVRSVPADAAPRDAIRRLADVVGRAPREVMVSGEVVRQARLGPPHRQGAALLLTVGRRALAIPTGETGLTLTVGDHVDVLATSAAAAAGGPADSRVVSADAVVIDTGERRIVVSVPADEATNVASALVTGTVTLALR